MTTRLNANENPYKKELDFNHFSPDWLSRYPDASYASLSEKIAGYIGCSADELVLANGSDELLDALLRSQFERGDKIATLNPTFSEYARLATVNGLDLLSANPDETSRHTPAESLLELIVNTKPQGLLLCNPNNPTGQFFKDEALKQFIEAMPDNAIIIIDEAYKEFCENGPPKRYSHQSKTVIQVRTLSKAFGFAGLRIGYGVFPKHTVKSILPYLPPYRIGHINVQLTDQLFSVDQMRCQVTQLLSEKAMLKSALKQVPTLKVFEGQGNFLWVKMLTPSRTKALLAKQKIAIRDFPSPNEAFCRISIGTHVENVRLIDCLMEVVNGN